MTGAKYRNLRQKLLARIRENGPLTVRDYMAACLGDPEFGYYRLGAPIGASGDFITAPEISQLFGELIGVWAVTVWRAMGCPSPLRLVELGPGRGTLMSDLLRASRVDPAFHQALSLHLVECNETLRETQAETLSCSGLPPQWHGDLSDVPEGAAILVANEFLDALPICQFEWRSGHWYERLVGMDEKDFLIFLPGEYPLEDQGALPPSLAGGEDLADGAIIEVNDNVPALMDELAVRAAAFPVATLFVDYGHTNSAAGETLQAVRRHAHADPLKRPGETDLTAHVDFEALGRTARDRGLHVFGPLTQARFLLGMGLKVRADRLLCEADGRQKTLIATGVQRLIDPAQMGELFKVVAIMSPGLAPPPPFDPRQD